MANTKIYFSEHDDTVGYRLKYWKEYMNDNFLDKMILIEAKRMVGDDYFYCNEYFEVGETRQSCGKICDGYKPNNGKNGRCKHWRFCYEETDKQFVLKRAGKKLFKVERYTPLDTVSSIA